MRILGPPSAPRYVVLKNIPASAHPRFTSEMFPRLWDAAVFYGVDPVGVVAQAYKETGGGNFTGRVKPEFYNTCGLKNRVLGLFPGVDDGDQPLAHARFASWDVGARAHVQHLRAYANWPVNGLIVDPRYWLVIGKHRCETFQDLNNKWADPGPTYGTDIVALAQKLRAVAV